MIKQFLLFVALSSALTLPAYSSAKTKKTPDELITELVEKKKAEIDSLKIADELNWYGITLLDAPAVKEAYKSGRGTSVHHLGSQGVWDKIEIETADNRIVDVAFTKKLTSMYDRSAFEASLTEHISKRLGSSTSSSRYKSTNWFIVKEAAFIKWWKDYYWCVIHKALKPGDLILKEICQRQPEQQRISEKISSVFFSQMGVNDVVLRVTSVAYSEAIARERERKKSEFGQQLEEGDTIN